MKKLILLLFAIVGILPAIAQTNTLEIPDIEIAPGETKTLVINLNNQTTFSGFQMDLVIPEGITIAEDEYGDPDIYFASGRAADHTLSSNYRNATTLAISSFSPKSRAFKGNSGAFLELSISASSSYSGSHQFKAVNVLFATSAGEEYPLADASGNIVGNVMATGIELNHSGLTLTEGETSQLTATVIPANATDKTVVWTTSNASVATVSNSGVVTAVALGTATITATCGSVSASCEVTVNPIEVEAITLNMAEVTMRVGQTAIVAATVSPSNATYPTISWTSADTNIATVDDDGVITAVALGQTIVTATANNGISASLRVTVEATPAESITLDHECPLKIWTIKN